MAQPSGAGEPELPLRADALGPERRRFRRMAVIWAATLETTHGAFDAIILNVSLGGARVRLPEPVSLLEKVTLVQNKLGRFSAEIVNQNGNEIGLQFVDPPEVIAMRFGIVFSVKPDA
jgi:hypothetical protein